MRVQWLVLKRNQVTIRVECRDSSGFFDSQVNSELIIYGDTIKVEAPVGAPNSDQYAGEDIEDSNSKVGVKQTVIVELQRDRILIQASKIENWITEGAPFGFFPKSHHFYISRSPDRSRFKVSADYLYMFRMSTFIYYNHCLILCSILHVNFLITIHQIRHSSSEHLILLQCPIWLVVYTQNELLQLFESFINCSTMNILYLSNKLYHIGCPLVLIWLG
jgi:hypothetical protein